MTINGKSVKLLAADPDPSKTVINGNNTVGETKVITYNNSPNSLLSGFTVTYCKYGVHTTNSDPNIENCIITGCFNGIWGNLGSNGLEIVNSTIRGGSSRGNQGINNMNGSLTIRGSTIENFQYGIMAACNIEVTNCTLKNNSTTAIHSSGSCLRTIKNSLIYDSPIGIYCSNTSSVGSIINGCTFYCSTKCLDMNSGPMPVHNSILWGSTTAPGYDIQYSCVQGQSVYDGTGNINSNPSFVKTTVPYDLHIRNGSWCINRGNPNYYFNPADGEADIDRQPRVWGSKIDMGADEYNVNDPDFDNNGQVNFIDFAILAKAWQATQGAANWNADCNIAGNSWGIDYQDLDIFVNWWLWRAEAYVMQSETLMGAQQQQEFGFEMLAAEMLYGEGELLMGPDFNYPAIYLTCDSNTPDVNDEVTIYVKSDWPLFCMEAAMFVTGDADIIDAMDSNEAPAYGWDPGWYWPELIDDGWVDIGGVRWVSDANGTVGYIKLRYNSGQVSVYFDQQLCLAYSWTEDYGAQIPFSQEAILIGRDPNEP